MAAKDWRPGPTVCRCCFAEGCYKDISTEYFWMGKREVYSEMLDETFDVSIAYSQITGPNSNSRLICEPCISRLRDASDFKRQVQECEKTFMHHLDPGRAIEVEVTMDRVEKEEVKLERVKLERKLSDDDFEPEPFADEPDDDDDDLDDQPLTKLATKVPKKESMDILDLLDNAKPEKRKSTTKVKASPSKKPKKKETPKPGASKAPVKAADKKKKDVDEDEVDPVKQNATIILANSTACPFHQGHNCIRCYFCSMRFVEATQFRAHLDTVHRHDNKSVPVSYEPYLTRVDITDLQCKICPKAFVTLERLASHLKDTHDLKIDTRQSLGLVPFRFGKDRLECGVCEQQFIGLFQLYRHTGKHYSTNICEICGKSFESLSGFKIHVQSHDAEKKYACLRCKSTFPSSAARRDHIQRNDSCKPLGCKLCKERFTHVERRDIHLTKVHGKPRKVYPCSKCEKVFNYRTTLLVHFKATHTELNKCEHCEKTFHSDQALKEHRNKFHTNERPYKCTVCDASYHSYVSAKRHIALHDENKKLHCEFCTRSFDRKDRLRNHIKKRHTVVK